MPWRCPLWGNCFNPGDVDHLTHVPYWSGHEMQSALAYAIAAVVLILVWKFGDRGRAQVAQCRVSVLQASVPSCSGIVERRGRRGRHKRSCRSLLSIDGLALQQWCLQWC